MNKKGTIVIIDYRSQTYNDPPYRNILEHYVNKNVEIYVLMSKKKSGYISEVHGCKTIYFDSLITALPNNIVYKLLKRILFYFYLNVLSFTKNKDVVITVMLEPVATLNRRYRSPFLISSVLDIPVKNAGRLDKYFNRRGWEKLVRSNLVWSSDKHKATLVQKLGGLRYMPTICHNCPSLTYLNEINREEYSIWLRNELKKNGANMDSEVSILLRAGAIGVFGGIEETFLAMKNLPPNFIFLMIGRPEKFYKQVLLKLIKEADLKGRAFLWEKPSDEVWKKCLLGADIGQMIHLKPIDNALIAESYELNSSLSNNRLFQYMAAGLPILSYDDLRLSELHDEVDCFEVVKTAQLTSDIARLWLKLAKDQSYRLELGKNGRSAHLNKYNWEFQFASIRSIIDARL